MRIIKENEYILNQARLKELVIYDHETGIFSWAISRRGVKKGSVAGAVKKRNCGKSYIYICIDYKIYRAHRLSILYMTGKFPVDEVDHIDGIGVNNAWSNLREVSRKENAKNMRLSVRNTSGVQGVYYDKGRSKWRSFIRISGKTKNLGYFNDLQEAKAVRKEAEIKHGYHENHGRNRSL